MPVTGCTWRSSPNAPGCWDRGEPPRPVRVGHPHPTAESLHLRAGSLFPWSRSCLPLLGRFWRLCGARRSWLDVGAGGVGVPVARDPRAPRKVQWPGASCACGDISVRPGTGDAFGDGIAVPDGVECPRPEGHAPGRAECPRPYWRRSGRRRGGWGWGRVAHTWHALSMTSDHHAVGPGLVDATRRRGTPSCERCQRRQRSDA